MSKKINEYLMSKTALSKVRNGSVGSWWVLWIKDLVSKLVLNRLIFLKNNLTINILWRAIHWNHEHPATLHFPIQNLCIDFLSTGLLKQKSLNYFNFKIEVFFNLKILRNSKVMLETKFKFFTLDQVNVFVNALKILKNMHILVETSSVTKSSVTE